MASLYLEYMGTMGVQFVAHANGRAIPFHRIPGSDKQIARVEFENDYRWLIERERQIRPYVPTPEGLALLEEIEREEQARRDKAIQQEAIERAKREILALQAKQKKEIEQAEEYMRNAGLAKMKATELDTAITQAEQKLLGLTGEPKPQEPDEPVKPKQRRKEK